MDLSPTQQLERARERFELGDYYGVLYLLHELVESGKAFADAHHLLGLSYYMVNRPEEAMASLDKAVELNPNYVEANIHRGILLAEMGRGDEAEASFAAARASGAEDRGGVAAHYAAKLANLHAEVGEAYAEAGMLGLAVEQYERALATVWDGCCSMRGARSRRASSWNWSSRPDRGRWTRTPPTASPAICRAMPAPLDGCGRGFARTIPTTCG
jgi:tetratricopeptide (TPR) repeat protein